MVPEKEADIGRKDLVCEEFAKWCWNAVWEGCLGPVALSFR